LEYRFTKYAKIQWITFW